MLESFVEWLDKYVVEKGNATVVRSVVGLVGFASLLGAIFGSSELVRGGAFVGLLLLILASGLALIADRRRIKNDREIYRKLLTRYCNFIIDDDRPLVQITRWNQVVDVARNGDVVERLKISLTPLREKLYFLRFRMGAGWDQPSRYRDRVRVDVRSISIEDERGPRWNVTQSWLEDGMLHVFAHFHQPALQGDEVHLEIKKVWPGKCYPLMQAGVPDSFTLVFASIMPVANVLYEVRLPSKLNAYHEPVGFRPSSNGMRIMRDESDERLTLKFVADAIPQGVEVGMRLELK